MGARQKPSFEQRVQEYVDSPLISQRLLHEQTVSAQFDGNYGLYWVTVSTDGKKVRGQCSCPSDLQPCKHVYALRATWDRNPKSFFDLDKWLIELRAQPKASLIEAIRNMVLHSPGLLCVFGVPGFEVEEEDPEEYD